jgi:hypothetical protein|tara:strand:- start:2406 stop:2609 length:204 start_codon:yes stop_codon:yes gene_type:complete
MKRNSVTSSIKEWISESENPRNDGWVQAHYRDRLREAFSLIDNFFNKKTHNESGASDDIEYNHLNLE